MILRLLFGALLIRAEKRYPGEIGISNAGENGGFLDHPLAIALNGSEYVIFQGRSFTVNLSCY